MKKILLCMAVACIAFAAKDDSGVGEYKASCKMCHGAPYKGSNMLASSEWEEMFASSSKKLRSVHAADDKSVPVINSINYFLSLKRNNVPAELHIYEKGGHGFGLAKNGGTESEWPDACLNWLKSKGFISN